MVFLAVISGQVAANPAGAQIINGQVNINTSVPGVTNITNSPNAIINWQDFSIRQGEVTRFIQQSSQSAVLNRVVGQNPSEIMGSLISNGQVFLINPNGIVFGANSFVDTQSLIASTLNLSNSDFLSGNYHFAAGDSENSILNEGIIRAGVDGNIILIAPDINNNGIIESDGGNIVLAAGQELVLTNLDNPEVRFLLQAAENEVLNLGKVLSESGAIDIFAGTISQSGEVSATSISQDESGSIRIVAQADITLTETSITSVNNHLGDAGSITVESQSGTTLVSGEVTAISASSQGGQVKILGEQVGIIDDAIIDSSGQTAGGEILIGGDYQGANTTVKNAQSSFVAQSALIKANALIEGDGGKIIVWSDGASRMYGQLEATGGELSGNGGFIETSGHYLDLGTFAPDVTANNGLGGTWLIDPYNINIVAGAGNLDPLTPNFNASADSSTLDNNVINTALNAGSNVLVSTGASGGTEAGNITLSSAISKTAGGNASLQFDAANNIIINADITSSSGALDLNLYSDLNDGGGQIYFGNSTISLSNGTISAYASSSRNTSSAIVNSIPATTTIFNSTFNNLGTLNVGGVLTLNGSSNNNPGTYGVAAGATLTINGNSTNNSGNFNIAGTLNLNGTTDIGFAENFYGAGSVFFANSANVTFSGTYLIPNNSTSFTFRGAPGPLTGASISTANNGILTFNGTTGIFTYQANPGFVGTDSFTYSHSDSSFGQTASGILYITVTASAATNIVASSTAVATNETLTLLAPSISTTTLSSTEPLPTESTTTSAEETTTEEASAEEDEQPTETVEELLAGQDTISEPTTEVAMQCQ